MGESTKPSAFTKPFVIRSDGTATMLERVPLSSGIDGRFNEEWLQKALFSNPLSLPIKEIDPHAGELIPVCMEMETGAGPADILYVTKTGQLVLVETKLWRNAEARREVVAQIIDYAKQLSTWSYEDLSRQTAMASKLGPDYLVSCVRKAYPDLNETEFEAEFGAGFVDGINRSLKTGDFLLIIAGDGIRSGAEALVDFIDRYGNLHFKLALVEIAAYRLSEDEILLQPRILAKTELLRRTVFVVQATSQLTEVEEEAEGSPVDAAKLAKNAQLAAWFEQFWRGYIEVLRLDDMQQPPPSRPARSTNMSLQMPPGNSQAWISAYIAQSQNTGGVFLTFAKSLASGPDLYDALYAEREEIAKVAPGLSWEKGADGKVWIQVPDIELGDLEDRANRQRVVVYLADQTNRMVNAFRHRLEALCRERLES
jgi:hypothetical protein